MSAAACSTLATWTLAIETSLRAKPPWSSSQAAFITSRRPISMPHGEVAEHELDALAVGEPDAEAVRARPA